MFTDFSSTVVRYPLIVIVLLHLLVKSAVKALDLLPSFAYLGPAF